MPRLSIITPVYRVEEDICQCLDSVINQRFQDWELILVDDCSPDSSGKICDAYAQKDSRIRVIHKEKQGGAARARRTGVLAATGEYIGFLDADDWIEPDMYQILTEQIADLNVDVVACSYFYNTKNKQTAKSDTAEVKRMNKLEAMKQLHTANGMMSCMMWDKIYRAEVLADYEIDKEIVVGEDYSLLVKTIEQCNALAYIDIPLYHYRQRAKSVCNAGYTEKRWLTVENYRFFNEYLTVNYPEVKGTADAFLLIEEMAVLMSMSKNGNYDQSAIKEIASDVRGGIGVLFRQACPLSFKISALLIYVHPKLLLLAGKIRYSIQKSELY
jgi:glycosyltransferase involved in cell wall biosynthesis